MRPILVWVNAWNDEGILVTDYRTHRRGYLLSDIPHMIEIMRLTQKSNLVLVDNNLVTW